MKLFYFGVLSASLCLASCTTPTVRSMHLKGDAVKTGVSYYLPKQMYNVTYGQKKDCSITFSIAAGDLIPDIKHRYVLQPIQSNLRDDVFKFTTDQNGLLTQSKTVATGVGETVIVNLAESLAIAGYTSEGAPQTCDPVTMVNQIDPMLANDRAAVDFIAAQAGRQILWDNELNTVREPSGSFNGVYYRRALPYRMVIGCPEGEVNDCVPQVVNLMLPQGSPTERLSPLGTPFATDSDDFTFTSGMLTSANSARKSEFTTIAGLPLKAVKAVLAVPADLLTLRTKNVTAEGANDLAQEKLINQALVNDKNRLDAEKAAIEAQNQLAAKEQELERANLDRQILENCVLLAGDDMAKVRACFP